MSRTLLVILVFIVAIAVIVIATSLYFMFYRHRINKQLQGENAKSHKLLPPWTFSIITAFIVLFILVGMTSIMLLSELGLGQSPSEYQTAVYDYQEYNSDQMTGYRSLYSMEENPGYTKTVEQQGEIRFSIFIRDDAFDYYHPAFIIYAEYTGSKDILYRGLQTRFFSPDGIQRTGKGNNGYPFEGYLCVIGTSTVQSTFELNVYLYDSALKSEDMEEYATASGTITVSIPSP